MGRTADARESRTRYVWLAVQATADGNRVTESGTDVVGRGPTGVAAAADYCSRLALDRRAEGLDLEDG
jgi:transcription initiation factor TFIIIB Brf1 subunit/transcription initiation factor TFIIB